VYGVDDLAGLSAGFVDHGFAILRGLWSEERLDAVQAACDGLQAQLVAGRLEERHGTTILVDDEGGDAAAGFANYVTYVTELSDEIRQASLDPVIASLVAGWLGPEHWFQESTRFGVVYQDARPGRESSYSRIGWHSDWQSGPHLAVWPSVAFTIHLDATSPANGFLRVVPGSHRWATPAPHDNVNGALVPPGSAEAGGHTDSRRRPRCPSASTRCRARWRCTASGATSCSTTRTSGTRPPAPPTTTACAATCGAGGSAAPRSTRRAGSGWTSS
jgi:hypothetical protein